jgi:hypothetical protein
VQVGSAIFPFSFVSLTCGSFPYTRDLHNASDSKKPICLASLRRKNNGMVYAEHNDGWLWVPREFENILRFEEVMRVTKIAC